MNNTKQTLAEYLSSLNFPTDSPVDGNIHRFQRDGSGASGWFTGYLVGDAEKNTTYATFGDWRTGEKYEWCGDSGNLSEEERTTLKEKYSAQCKERGLEKIAMQQSCGDAAAGFVSSAEVLTQDRLDTHPYFIKKGVDSTALVGSSLHYSGGKIIVPMYDSVGICNYQTINANGEKMFSAGCKVSGAFFTVKCGGVGCPTYIAEGLATAMSVSMAVSDATVVVCFNAGNMSEVAKQFKGAGKLYYCADNDWKTTRQGVPHNTGLLAATNAAGAHGGTVLLPEFEKKDCGDGYPTDLNDFHKLYGLGALREFIQSKAIKEVPAPKISGQLDFLQVIGNIPKVEWRQSKKDGSAVPPEQNDIAVNAVEHLKRCLVKQDRDLFFYTGTHWELLDMGRVDQLKVEIMLSSGAASYTSAKLEGTFKLFMVGLPRVGVENIFSPHTSAVNFLNGTLFLLPGRDDLNKRELVFRPHSKSDYLLNVLPYDYLPDNKERNTEFEEMLQRVCLSDDVEETAKKIEAVQMLFGACLAPDFPILYFLYGPPATGKSTVMKLLNRFISPKNICSVEPSEFTGFNMESMAGKLVNMDADISLNKPIADSVIKKIIDRVPMRVQRKNRDDLYAPMPAVHVFGANELPRTMDRGSGAHQRRWVLVEFTNPQVKDNGPLNLKYDEYCYSISPQGILNFALEGLRKLCISGGTFTRPESGIERLREWEKDSNPVALFVEDIRSGEVTDRNVLVAVDTDCSSDRIKVWNVYRKWSEDANKRLMGRNTFYRELSKKGFKTKKVGGRHLVQGLKVDESKNAEF